MKKKLIFLFFTYVFFTISLNASVGLYTYTLDSELRKSKIQVSVFYPSDEKEEYILGEHKLFISEKFAFEKKILNSRFPVVLLSHGGLRSSNNQINWLAKYLASNGYIVLLTKAKNLDTKSVIYEPLFRVNDMNIAYKHLSKQAFFKNHLDDKNINIVSFLLGATSSLLYVGVTFDFKKYINQCRSIKKSMDCLWYEKNKISFTNFDTSLVKKVIPLANVKKLILFDTELSTLFNKKSLEGLTQNILIINLANNISLLDNNKLQNNIKNSKYTKVLNSNVFSSFSLCSKKGKKILKGDKNNPNLCSNSNNIDKKVIHNKIEKIVWDYLNNGL